MNTFDDRVNNKLFLIINDENKDRPKIQAWSDNKDLIDAYLTFHSNSNYRLKKINMSSNKIDEIIEDNFHDELILYNALTKDPNKKSGIRTVIIPITKQELDILQTEKSGFMAGRISYSIINSKIHSMKNKYQKALSTLSLYSVLMYVIHGEADEYIECMDFDEVKLLFKSIPDSFGM